LHYFGTDAAWAAEDVTPVDSPQISVVMPAYNAEPYIQHAIRSILNQTFEAFELIVVVADSSDRTSTIVKRAAAEDSRIRLQRQPRTGIVDGRNLGAQLARAPYIAWLDADDVAVPRRLELQVRFMDRHPDVAVLGGSILATDQTLKALFPVRYPTDIGRVSATLPRANALAASTAMIRTSAYHVVGGCRTAFKQGAEDYDLWLRLSESFQLANLPELLGYYRIHPDQVSGTRVERFVLPTVAAQLSAWARRDGRDDPYGEMDAFTYAALVNIEPSAARVDTVLLDATAAEAIFLTLVGQVSDAIALLDWAKAITSGSRIPRQTRARVLLANSLVAWGDKRTTNAIYSTARAALLDPRHIARMLTSGIAAKLWRDVPN
jgi:hypothetical protein